MPRTPSRPRRLGATLLVGALVPLAVSMPASAGATTAPAAAPVEARTATLTTHPSGLPAAGSAQARRISSAKVTQDLVHDRLKATITLGATPTSATNAQVHIEFGNAVGNSCEGDEDGSASSPTYSGLSAGFTRSGRTITLDKVVDEAGYMVWDCAFVVTTVPGSDTTYDAVVGGLKDVVAKPKLTIPAVQLLRKNVKKVKLVPKVWTVLEVKVKNPSRVSATKVVVKGSGKGLRVKNVNLGKIYDDSSALARVRVRLTRKKATTL